MNFSEVFIRRPVATTLFTSGIVLAGATAFINLPVSPLPQVDQPTIQVQASMAGASPETMATTVATPLERHLGTIADVTEMTSSSSVGSTGITLQFGLSRNIDGAARDVQAAINAARVDLPTALRSNPTYRKVNPADAPIMILAMTSATLTQGELYDKASTILQQKLLQVEGVGDVGVGGSSLPAVRVELNPSAMFKYGVGLEDVRAALAAANANSPKGAIENATLHWQIYDNDQSRSAKDYNSLVVAYRNGSPVRLTDVAEISDSVEDIRNLGISKGEPAVLVIISRQPQANIIDTVDRIRALLPRLRANIPPAAQLEVAQDRSTVIRASLRTVEQSLTIAIILVVLVVYVFLRDGRAVLVPAVAVPVSLVGTFAAMYLLGYSLDNLSLMALTIATGFVVDDAIVVMENIVRNMENGVPRFQAALIGVRQVGFTVLSMSLSLIAVFIPILLMGGVVGLYLPRIRGDALSRDPHLDGHLAHDDADDVRPAAQHPPQGRAEGALPPLERRRLSDRAHRLQALADVGAQPQALDALRAPRDGGDERLAVHDHTEGLLPRAGHWAHVRLHPGRPEHLVPKDIPEAQAVCDHHPGRQGC